VNMPIISVIIPTHNSESTIERCIRSLTLQSYPREKFEIIVVDDGSKDQTVEYAKKDGADMIVISEPCTLGHARNLAAEKAQGKFLAYIDSDCEAKEGWLGTIAKELETLSAITGPIENGASQSLVAWSEYLLEFSEFNEYKSRSQTNFLPGCNQACTKESYKAAGGFPDLRLSEDVFFGESLKRAGIIPYFIPEMQIRHLGTTDMKKFLSKMELYGRYTVRNCKTVPSIYTVLTRTRWFIPLVFAVKFGARLRRAVRTRKLRIFIISLPIILHGISRFCIGVWKEREQATWI